MGVVVVVAVDDVNETLSSAQASRESLNEVDEEIDIYEKIKKIVLPIENAFAFSLNNKASTSVASSIVGITLKSSSLPIPIPYQKALK